MKLDFIKTFISIGVSCLIAYGFYIFNTDLNKDLLGIGSLILLITTLTLTIGVSFDLPRTTTLIRTVSIIFFAAALLSNFVFSLVDFAEATYIIVNGILFLIYVLTIYSIERAKQ